MAVNIATALAKEHKSSLLVDLKLHAGDLAALLDLKPAHTLAELCVSAAEIVLLVLRLDFTCLRKEVPASKAQEALGVSIAHYVPEDPKTVNRANNNGVPVVLDSPSARVSRSLVQLAHSVNGRKP